MPAIHWPDSYDQAIMLSTTSARLFLLTVLTTSTAGVRHKSLGRSPEGPLPADVVDIQIDEPIFDWSAACPSEAEHFGTRCKWTGGDSRLFYVKCWQPGTTQPISVEGRCPVQSTCWPLEGTPIRPIYPPPSDGSPLSNLICRRTAVTRVRQRTQRPEDWVPGDGPYTARATRKRKHKHRGRLFVGMIDVGELVGSSAAVAPPPRGRRRRPRVQVKSRMVYGRHDVAGSRFAPRAQTSNRQSGCYVPIAAAVVPVGVVAEGGVLPSSEETPVAVSETLLTNLDPPATTTQPDMYADMVDDELYALFDPHERLAFAETVYGTG